MASMVGIFCALLVNVPEHGGHAGHGPALRAGDHRYDNTIPGRNCPSVAGTHHQLIILLLRALSSIGRAGSS